MDLFEKTRLALQSSFPENTVAPRFFSAPGRVNLIGEHTDYNDGFVLPVAINFQTVVAAIPHPGSIIQILAIDKDETDTFDLTQPIERTPTKTWANYARGLAKILLAADHPLQGVTMAVAGDVPTSGGLSSSASFEMALGHTFLQMSHVSVDGVTLARYGQQAENEFVGVQCGIMDQFISVLGQKGHALLINCRSLNYQAVPIPNDTAIIVIDSGVQRGLVDSEYNIRRQQCETAARFFGVAALRDVDEATFNCRAAELDPVIRRRARHVITENARTLQVAQALASGNLAALGPLMAESHRSMREDFEITVPAIDTLVDIIQAVPGVYGARMTGGGFGGCCVALAPTDVAPKITKAVAAQYQAQTGYKATIYLCQASAGAQEVLI